MELEIYLNQLVQIAQSTDEPSTKLQLIKNLLQNIEHTDLPKQSTLALTDVMEREMFQLIGKKQSIITGFRNFDTNGAYFNKGDLISIGAVPGMGKTFFSLHLGHQMANHHKVLYFSMGVQAIDVLQRLHAIQRKLPFFQEALKDRVVDIFESKKGIQEPLRSNFYLNTTIWRSTDQLLNEIKTQVELHHIEVVFIDHYQFIVSNFSRLMREKETTYLIKSLKALATELKICIVGTSVLKSRVFTRLEKYPDISDFKDSGYIESFSDVVLLLHRPAYYGLFSSIDGYNTRNLLEVHIAKSRFTQWTAKFYLSFEPSLLEDWSEKHEAYDIESII